MVRILSMPADGSCLYWALGWWYDVPGPVLRKLLISHIVAHPRMKIHGVPLSDWIQWESDLTLPQYVSAMKQGEWGGTIEMAIFNELTGSAVTVWERRPNGRLRKIDHFEGDDRPHCHIVYLNRNHYGVLVD